MVEGIFISIIKKWYYKQNSGNSYYNLFFNNATIILQNKADNPN
ncbi:MAG: hypothetical protein RHS_1638 [Robinsoniella sp. RHS]|nr:MAG: hypothetical protein RHS_1638 [Robinsoniella sp. RHS]